MSEYTALIEWSFTGGEFLAGRYSREHHWRFDGGLEIAASPSPHAVPAPYSNAAHVDPEEAFVASIASCHMLTFLWLASRAGFHVSHYADHATGTLTKNEHRVPWISSVILEPKIQYLGPAPTRERSEHLHEQAHAQCFIANSVKTEISVRLEPDPAGPSSR